VSAREDTVTMTTDVDQVAAWLAAMDEEQFRGITGEDAHGRLDSEASKGLRHPKVRRRWYGMLRILLADVNAQLAGKSGDRSEETEAWRRKALHWQIGLMERRSEARRLCTERTFVSAESREESRRARRARGEAGNVAVQRLIDAHREEFEQLLAEELSRAVEAS
jgi:hypothetical protein